VHLQLTKERKIMFWKKNNPEYLVKFKQDRYQNWIIESLRIPAKSEEELIDSVKRITEQIMLQLKEMNE
tara:strand:+ start:245 stop:451 length:207 start_codon:yes stop_codon:yes gene_type:complete